MKNEGFNRPEESVALRRFAYVSKIEELLRQDYQLSRALEEAACNPPPDPEGQQGRLHSPSTLEDWWYAYKYGGFGALYPKGRSDRGQPRRLTPAQKEWVLKEVRSHPKASVKLLYRRWKSQDPTLPSVSAIYRFLHSSSLSAKDRREGSPAASGPTKSFEAATPGELWMVDFSTGPYIPAGAEGKLVRSWLCLIVDDHSRLIPYAAYYPAADTAAFLATLKEAVARRGIPYKIYTDHGKSFVNHHVRIVCANLGIRLLQAAPYHAWSKGKVERLHKTIQQDFEAGLELSAEAVGSFEELNQKLAWWIQSVYHARTHATTGMSPQERFAQGAHLVRHLQATASIERLFYTRQDRTVRKDGTIRIDHQLYEVDLALRGLKVELRFNPYGQGEVEVYRQGQSFGLARPLNRQINSQISPGDSYEKDRS